MKTWGVNVDHDHYDFKSEQRALAFIQRVRALEPDSEITMIGPDGKATKF